MVTAEVQQVITRSKGKAAEWEAQEAIRKQAAQWIKEANEQCAAEVRAGAREEAGKTAGARKWKYASSDDKRGTKSKWLRRLSEQLSGVAEQMEKEEEQREHMARTTTKEMVMLRAQLHELQEELAQAKEGSRQATGSQHGDSRSTAGYHSVEGEARRMGSPGGNQKTSGTMDQRGQ